MSESNSDIDHKYATAGPAERVSAVMIAFGTNLSWPCLFAYVVVHHMHIVLYDCMARL
jgi:hypothetical protein